MCNFYTIVSQTLNFAIKRFFFIFMVSHEFLFYTSNTTKYIFEPFALTTGSRYS